MDTLCIRLVSPPLISALICRPTFMVMKTEKSSEPERGRERTDTVRGRDRAEAVGLPEVGVLVRDASGRIGRLMAYTRARAWLRPPGGGREWDVEPDTISEIPGWDAATAGKEGAARDR
jgi:hypothetical protein